jgi:hypothetical protein
LQDDLDKMYKALLAQNPNKYPVRMGESWSKEELEQVKEEVRSGMTVSEIADKHSRTCGGIRAKVKLITNGHTEKKGCWSFKDSIKLFNALQKGMDLQAMEDILNRDMKYITSKINKIIVVSYQNDMSVEDIAKLTGKTTLQIIPVLARNMKTLNISNETLINEIYKTKK